MTVEQLAEHITTLAGLEETNAPVITCYLNVSGNVAEWRQFLEERMNLLRSTFANPDLTWFQEAAASIWEFLNGGLAMHTRGIAVFARGGVQPFFLPLQFEVSLLNNIVVDRTPKLFGLVELKNGYDRYVVLLMTQSLARMIGVNLGALTEQLWTTRAQMSHTAQGQAVSRAPEEITQRFVHETARRLERFVCEGGYDYVILAGDPRAAADIRSALPVKLLAKLVDTLPASPGDRACDLIRATLPSLLGHKQLESQEITKILTTQVNTPGFAVTGAGASFRALNEGRVQVLVLLESFDHGLGWECRDCGKIETNAAKPEICVWCRSPRVRECEIREELVRLAVRRGCRVDVVKVNEALQTLGGVGCLLDCRRLSRNRPCAVPPLVGSRG